MVFNRQKHQQPAMQPHLHPLLSWLKPFKCVKDRDSSFCYDSTLGPGRIRGHYRCWWSIFCPTLLAFYVLKLWTLMKKLYYNKLTFCLVPCGCQQKLAVHKVSLCSYSSISIQMWMLWNHSCMLNDVFGLKLETILGSSHNQIGTQTFGIWNAMQHATAII